MSLPLAMNGRILSGPLTGVQRYTLELMRRLCPPASLIRPNAPTHGMRGHLWEQFVLPSLLKGRPLWSTANSGPLRVREQVVTIHDVLPLDCPEWVGKQYGAWFRWLVPRLVTQVAAVIVDSRFTAERLMTLTDVAEERVHVIPLGVDQAFRKCSETQVSDARKALGIPDGPYFLSLGSMDLRRNLGTLLDAWPTVRRGIPGCSLVLAGAPLAPRVHGHVRPPAALDGVHFTGRVPESLLPAVYSGAVAFVFMSRYEGFGLPVAEAMACGIPVVTANTSSLPETVGDAGILLDPGDANALAAALQSLGTDERYRAELGESCAARGASWSWDVCAERTMRVLHDSLGIPIANSLVSARRER